MNKQQNIVKYKATVIALLLLCGSFNSAKAQETDYKAYTLFVYNFMKYVEWPEAQSKGDFILAVMGDSPINKELQALANAKKIKGRNIILRKCNTVEDTYGCHLVFVPNSKSAMVKALREQTKDKPVLIVGEREGMAKKGAGLSFVTEEGDELKFDINKKEIEQHQLKISSQLVSLGTLIN